MLYRTLFFLLVLLSGVSFSVFSDGVSAWFSMYFSCKQSELKGLYVIFGLTWARIIFFVEVKGLLSMQ